MMCVFGRVTSQLGDVQIQSVVGMSASVVFAILSYQIQIRRISLDIHGSRIVNFAEV